MLRATLCWSCARAVGGCSWSQYRVQSPVPGWEAVRHDIKIADGLPLVESYEVISCPLFVPDRPIEPDRRMEWTAEQVEILTRMRAAGAPGREIADALGCKIGAVYRKLEKMRLEEEKFHG